MNLSIKKNYDVKEKYECKRYKMSLNDLKTEFPNVFLMVNKLKELYFVRKENAQLKLTKV